MFNWTPAFSYVILEMCNDAILMGTHRISWPDWLVDSVMSRYQYLIHLRAEIWAAG